MAITFPNSPSSGDTHTTSNGLQYTYDGEKWTTIGTNSAGTWTRTGTTVSLTTATDDLNVDSGTLFVDASTNNVGVGTTSPSSPLTVTQSTANINLELHSTSSGRGTQIKTHNDHATFYHGLAGDTTGDYIYYTAGAKNHLFYTNNSERLRIDSAGRLLVGASTAQGNSLLQVEGDSSSAAAQGSLSLRRGLNTAAIGGNVGADLGKITFGGNDGTVAATIRSQSDAAWSSTSDCPGNIQFLTTADGASSPTERLRIDSSGNVGIGTTSPQSKLSVGNGASIDSGLSITFTGDNSTLAKFFANTATGEITIGGVATNYFPTFHSNGSERMRIDSLGRVGIGTTTPDANVDIRGTNPSALFSNSNRSKAYRIQLNETADALVINDNDVAERIRIDSAGNVGIGTASPQTPFGGIGLQLGNTSSSRTTLTFQAGTSASSSIYFSDGTSGTDRYRGFVEYIHASDALTIGTTSSERLRIDSSGSLLLGTSTPSAMGGRLLTVGDTSRSSSYLEVRTSTSGDSGVLFSDGTVGNDSGYRGTIEYSHSVDELFFKTAGANRMRIDSSGSVFIGNHTSVATYSRGISFGDTSASTSYQRIGHNATGATYSYILFGHGSSDIGSIQQNSGGTSVSYNTSSDYRLKENVVDIADGITRVKQLQPKRFNFIVDADTTVDGFLAHEAQAVVPEAVTGEKDGEEMQGIDQSKLVPLLTAALKEVITELETLKAEVAALKSA